MMPANVGTAAGPAGTAAAEHAAAPILTLRTGDSTLILNQLLQDPKEHSQQYPAYRPMEREEIDEHEAIREAVDAGWAFHQYNNPTGGLAYHAVKDAGDNHNRKHMLFENIEAVNASRLRLTAHTTQPHFLQPSQAIPLPSQAAYTVFLSDLADHTKAITTLKDYINSHITNINLLTQSTQHDRRLLKGCSKAVAKKLIATPPGPERVEVLARSAQLASNVDTKLDEHLQELRALHDKATARSWITPQEANDQFTAIRQAVHDYNDQAAFFPLPVPETIWQTKRPNRNRAAQDQALYPPHDVGEAKDDYEDFDEEG
jgi:hypothetical protein